MKIAVGSQNKTKVTAVKDAVGLYPNLFPSPEVTGVNVEVDEFGHPKDIKSTVEGAIERAKQVFSSSYAFSFGLEGGLMEVPHSKSGYMEVGACAVYNGEDIFLGLSPAFEWPKDVTELIVEDKADASQAFKQLGLTDNKKQGAMEGGIIGMLTEGRLTREEQTKGSIIMALIHLEREEYKTKD